MKNGVKCCCIIILCVFVGCKAGIEQIAKEDNIRGEAKENLKRCEIEKDFKACGYLASAYKTGRMAKQSDEKATLYFEKACQLRNEAYDKLVVSNLDELKSLRDKYGINPCDMAAHKKLLQFGFKKYGAFLKSEKAKEIMPLYEQSCLNAEYTDSRCFLSAEYHLFNGNYDKAKEFGLLSCLKGENKFKKNGCEYYSENVLKQKPYFRD